MRVTIAGSCCPPLPILCVRVLLVGLRLVGCRAERLVHELSAAASPTVSPAWFSLWTTMHGDRRGMMRWIRNSVPKTRVSGHPGQSPFTASPDMPILKQPGHAQSRAGCDHPPESARGPRTRWVLPRSGRGCRGPVWFHLAHNRPSLVEGLHPAPSIPTVHPPRPASGIVLRYLYGTSVADVCDTASVLLNLP